MRIVLITSDHQRHRWLASRLADAGRLVGLVAESKPAGTPSSIANADADVRAYFEARDAAERRYFADAPPFDALGAAVRRVSWGEANEPAVADFVDRLQPDLVALFGSCIIREPLLGRHQGRIVNMHLGLSPYYRGSATNFWPLVDGLPECVGVTIHHATPKVDGGNVLVQARPAAAAGDTAHDLGCKTILAGGEALVALLKTRAVRAGACTGHPQTGGGKLCRRADFTPDALRRMQARLAEGMLDDYVADKSRRDARYPIHATPPA